VPARRRRTNQILSDPPFQFYPWFRDLGQALRHAGIPQLESAADPLKRTPTRAPSKGSWATQAP
jgi:hypothetical protein